MIDDFIQSTIAGKTPCVFHAMSSQSIFIQSTIAGKNVCLWQQIKADGPFLNIALGA